MSHSAPRHAAKAVERFVFFSDAVFAFALTLQAITLKLPPGAHRPDAAQVWALLAATVPALFCYALSFGVVAMMWVRHHRLFEPLVDYDPPLIALNFALLFLISLFPFAIELLTHSRGSSVPLAAYCALISLVGVASFAIWWHLQRTSGLVRAPLSGSAFRRQLARELSMPVLGAALCAAGALLPPDKFALASLTAGVAVALLRRFLPAPEPAPAGEVEVERAE